MDRPTTKLARWALLGLLLVALSAASASCSVREDERSTHIDGLGSTLPEIQRLARREGRLELVVWPGYAEESWVETFTQETGCAVTARVATSSESMRGLLETGAWDGVSASGDLSGALMSAGRVAPVDPELVPNYAQIVEGLEERPFNSVDGQPFGVPHGRVPTLLLFRTDLLPPGTDSWRALWKAPASYTGRLSLYDEPIALADAAVYLAAARPELGIEDPYALDQRQFRAVVNVVRRAPRAGRYWTRASAQDVSSYVSTDTVAGTGWPQQAERAEQTGAPVLAIKPVEGSTGWSDTWMVSRRPEHPNCMYLWMDYALSPEVQARSAELTGQAPANLVACQLTRDPDHCDELRADDEAWWTGVHYWTTPAVDCGDARGDSCVPYEDWATAWARIKARR